MTRGLIAACAALTLAVASPVLAASTPANWDGLVKTKAKHMDSAYLLPGADFRGYTKVMLEPTEVAFQKDWQRNYNDSTADPSNRISDADAREIAAKVRTGFESIFEKAYTDAGYAIVTQPGPDVLRLRTAVINLYVATPDRMSPGISRTYSAEAGEGTVVLEARDSVSGALLGRAVDRRTAGDMAPYVRNSVTNRGDFAQLFQGWAKSSVDGLNELKAMSPVQAATR